VRVPSRLRAFPLVLFGAVGGGLLLLLTLLRLFAAPDAPVQRVFGGNWTEDWLLPAFGAICLGLALLAYDRHRTFVAAQRAEWSFRDLYQSIGEGVFRSTLNGALISANPALVRLHGYETEEELLENFSARGWYVDPNRRTEILDMLLRKGRVTNLVSEVYRHRSRQRIWVEESLRLLRDEKTGAPLYYDGTVRDVTETVRRLELEERYSKIASIMSGCLLQLKRSPEGTYCMPYVSVGLYHLCGIRPEQVAEDSTVYRDRIHPDDFKRVEEAMKLSERTLAPFQCEFRLCHPDGTEKWVLAHSVPELEADGSMLWHGYMIEISDRKRSEARVYELAYFDPLTHLPNRTLLKDRLSLGLSQGEWQSGGALLFVDLDHFKVLNDTKGHHVGDLFLCEVSRRIGSGIGPADFVARLGGDEFVVLLQGLSRDVAKAKAEVQAIGERLLSAIDQPFRFEEDSFQTTASIGAVLLSPTEQDVEELLKRADLAMYEAKTAGRGTLRFFETPMQIAAADRLALTSELRRARSEGGLMLYYQPMVESSGRCIGAECLLRWNHPTRGLIAAGEFIGIAERSGFMSSIDNWVLRAACATLKDWERDPRTRDLRLAVNVSAQELSRLDFVAVVEDVLAETGARPDRLTLELTEHVMLDDFEAVNTVMQRLQALGLNLALDDFGTGYSSLSYLKRLPIDTLKIDKSFVHDIESNESDREIVQTIVNIAKSLKISVTAEGVETELQALLLRRLGCHAFQGYLFGKPMALDAFRAYLDDPVATEGAERGMRAQS
jgi:diguanylate cyclase (GGDEF)-like protein/PAS domain S-box-containing protein